MKVKIYILVFFLAWQCTAVFGQSKAALTNEKKKLEQEIAAQKKLLAATQKNKNLSLREIQLINNQIKNQEKLISTINTEIEGLNEQISNKEQELGQLKNKLELLKEGYKNAVYAAYKYRNVTNKMGFILSAESIAQAITRANYLAEYTRAMKNQLDIIIRTQDQIQQQTDELIQHKNEKSQLAQNKITEKENLSRQEREKERIVANLKKQESNINQQIKQKVARQKVVEAAIKKIIDAEIAKANAAKQAATGTSSKTPAANKSTETVLRMTPQETALAKDFESNRGKLPWPVEKGNIISRYGNDSHPEVSSVTITNNGINILTEKGAAVRAVFNGVVTAVADISGTKAVILKHGNYFTVYTNLASVNVKQGQSVSTKQIIGRLYQETNDPHSELHFEIWKEKVHQNPSLWILK
ncbi:MAG: peptidoglycan DD-metalloendopeptidase family protein [Bacteroidales bacterium]|nr:peptidoglycan DD-metalloendopeptidase family protein [Bacteroidales bacterium]